MHHAQINSKPDINLLFSLIYYVEQIVYGHYGWLKTMSHNCVRSATIKFRVCVYFVYAVSVNLLLKHWTIHSHLQHILALVQCHCLSAFHVRICTLESMFFLLLSHQSLYRWLLVVLFDVWSKSCAKSNENYYTELINQCRSDKWLSHIQCVYACVSVCWALNLFNWFHLVIFWPMHIETHFTTRQCSLIFDRNYSVFSLFLCVFVLK